MTGEVVMLVGALLILVAAIGVVRFDDVLARMHALTKGSVAGIVLLLAGAAISLNDANDITSLVLAAVLQALASPPASNLLSRAVYLAEDFPHRLDVIDDGIVGLDDVIDDEAAARDDGSGGAVSP
jgi:multicomponent Na+:H+ antiporter subunit G